MDGTAVVVASNIARAGGKKLLSDAGPSCLQRVVTVEVEEGRNRKAQEAKRTYGRIICNSKPQLAVLVSFGLGGATGNDGRSSPRHGHVEEGQVVESVLACDASVDLLRPNVPHHIAKQLGELESNERQNWRVDVLVGANHGRYELLELAAGKGLRAWCCCLQKRIALQQCGPFLFARHE